MQHGLPLHEYRIFCSDCMASLDVKAVNPDEDTNREARKKGWSVDQDSVLCPLCFQIDRREMRKIPTLNDKELL